MAPHDRATAPRHRRSRSLTTTRAPSAANLRASAAPMPLPAPVTTTPAPATDLIAAPSLRWTQQLLCVAFVQAGRRQVHQGGQRGPVPVRRAERRATRLLARLSSRCAGCSQVKPIPPCSCTHSCAACTAASPQAALARATATGMSGSPSARQAAAYLGGGPGLGHRDPHVGQPVLERLERAHRAGELAPFLDVGDGHARGSAAPHRAARRRVIARPDGERGGHRAARRPRRAPPAGPARCPASRRPAAWWRPGTPPAPGSPRPRRRPPRTGRTATPSPGTRSTSAASASATPLTARTEPHHAGRVAGLRLATRTGQTVRPPPPPLHGARRRLPRTATASAAVSRPDASPPSRSGSPVPSSAVVAITALPRYGTEATALPVSSATTAASR